MAELDARLAVVGNGRLGNALIAALPGAHGPFGRGFDGVDADGTTFDVVLLAVPDAQIGAAAAVVRPGPMVGHCSGATGLEVLAPHESFGLHPLMTITREGAVFTGCGAAIAGSTDAALRVATALAERLGMQPVHIADTDRVAYHAAASIASNFLVTLEDAAETLLATTGAPRSLLVPLVRATVENWAALGGSDALTGPIARGDDAVVARHREAIVARAPELLPLFDELCIRTRALAARDR